MSGLAHRDSGLHKSVWTDEDFDQMGWHDATLRAVGLHEESDKQLWTGPRLLLDLDYIVRWIDPEPPEEHFTFWVAPVTLVFNDVWDLTGDISYGGAFSMMETSDLHRVASDDGPQNAPLWHLEGHHGFDLRFRAPGFRQYVRQAPLHVARQNLTFEERGGIGFAEVGFV